VADLLSVNERTVYRMAQRGELPGFKVAGTWRFLQQDIEAWIDQRKRDAAERSDNKIRSGDGGSC
jgi:excisionase family DNA binding protein